MTRPVNQGEATDTESRRTDGQGNYQSRVMMCQATHSPMCSANYKHMSPGPALAAAMTVKRIQSLSSLSKGGGGRQQLLNRTSQYLMSLPKCDCRPEEGPLTLAGAVSRGAPKEGSLT